MPRLQALCETCHTLRQYAESEDWIALQSLLPQLQSQASEIAQLPAAELREATNALNQLNAAIDTTVTRQAEILALIKSLEARPASQPDE